MKYIDWLFQWLENYVRLSVKTRTYERYKLIVEQHISQEIETLRSIACLCKRCSLGFKVLPRREGRACYR